MTYQTKRWTSKVVYAVTETEDKVAMLSYDEHDELDHKMDVAQIQWPSLRSISTVYNGGYGTVVPMSQLFFDGDLEPMSEAWH